MTEKSTGDCGRLLGPSAVPLSLTVQKGHGVTLLVPAVAGGTSAREGETYLPGRRVTTYVHVKSEALKSRLGPGTSEAHNLKPACPLTWVTAS